MDDVNRYPVEEKKVKFKKSYVATSKKQNVIWIVIITIVSFLVSVVLTIASSNILKESAIFTALLLILFFIFMNVLFDTIGTAVTAADETPFHAMASRKVFGARQAIRIVRNADKVSNLCNDVIGDICGIISGAAGAYLIFRIIGSSQQVTAMELVITGTITAFTVSGKSLGKIIAIRNSNFIVYKVSVIIQFVTGRFYRTKRKGNNRK